MIHWFYTFISISLQEMTTSFFEVLSLCHTVQIEEATPNVISNGNGSAASLPTSPKSAETNETSLDFVDSTHAVNGSAPKNGNISPDGSGYNYNAASPDEKALVEACRL